MARISIADGQTHEMLDYITLKHIISDNHKKSLEDTLETYDFITFGDKRFSQYLEKRNRIIIPDEDDTLVEFVIFEAHKYKDSEGYKAQVYAHASYLELKKASIIYPDTYEGTASQHAGRAVNNTGWRVGIVESNSSIPLDFENHSNPFAYLKRIAREVDLELKFRIEHDGTKITGRYVDLLERVGAWRNRTVEMGKDLDGIIRIEKQDIVTALLGVGPEDADGNRLEVFVEDKDALQRWGRLDEKGELHHLVGTHVIQSTRTEMTEQEAIQYTRTELNKRINTVVTYECGVVDLEHVPGMENKQIRHGDTIRIKDTSFNPPLYLEARVYEQNGSIKTRAKRDIKLGDFVEFTEEEVHDVWRELRKEIRKKISQSDLIEYTYDKVTIDGKDEVVFKDGKSFAEAVGIEAKEYAESQDEIVKQHADSVANQAENNAKSYAEDRSAEALQQALAKSVAQEVYDNKMQEIASDLADRTTLEYVDGQLVDKANVGDVYTIEDVDNMFNNVVSITEYETDMDGIVQTLDNQSTQIGQNVEAIGLKADSSRVDAIEGTVEDHNAQFIVMDNRINSKVDSTYVQGAIDGIEVGGRNLLKNTGLTNGLSGWSGASIYELNGETVFRATGTMSENANIPLEPNQYYTTSMDIYPTVDVPITNSTPLHTYFRDSSSNNGGTGSRTVIQQGSVAKANEWTRITEVVKTNENVTTYKFYVYYPAYINSTNPAYVKNIKFEKGNKATDWTPAPEDTQAEIDSVYIYASSEMDQLAGRIDLKAESTYVDGVEQRVTTAEQTIDAIDGRISMVVTEQGTINADAIASEISLTSSAIDLISSEINLSANQINFDGHVFGGDATFTGTIEGATIRGSSFGARDTSNSSYDSEAHFNATQLMIQRLYKGEDSVEAYVSISPTEFVSHGLSFDLYGSGINLMAENGTPRGSIWSGSSAGQSVIGLTSTQVVRLNGAAIELNATSLTANDNEVETIVSQGSNADGRWIRYSSGKQEVWCSPVAQSTNISSGNVYRSNSSFVSFPQDFITSHPISCQINVSSTSRWAIMASNPGSGGVDVRQFNTVQSTALLSTFVYAVGRWR